MDQHFLAWTPSVMMFLALAAILWRSGATISRLETLLDILTKKSEKHDERLIDLERPRRRVRK